jgi:predicted PurR-regulated permease PerM
MTATTRTRLARLAPWVGAALLAGALLYLGRSVLLPFFLALLIAYVLDPVIDWLEARRIPRAAAILIFVLAMLLAASLLVVGVVPELQRQIERFSRRLPGYREAAEARLAPLVAWVREHFPEAIADLREQGVALAKENLPRLLAPIVGFLTRTTSSLVNLIVGTLNLVVIPVLAFYLLKDIDRLRAAAATWLPLRWRSQVLEIAGEVDVSLRRFLRGQLTVAAILAVLYALGLSLMGVPLGILVGLVAGLANIVPYLGIAVGLIPALGLSFLDAGDPLRLLGIVGVFAGAQALEGMVITPRVVGQELGLHPVVVLVAVIVGGQAFGFLGILLAVPFTAAAAVLFRRARRGYFASDFYARTGPPPAAPPPPRRVRNRTGY